ncbi:bifunctional DNA primase/polymerase [Kitasatospora sp. NPDC058965]|uniref:bifunctional DNA primase/polymerase n=1 Tax=Kitasatospora sp. NPDC058965 TaxID=3346682 RepID=UPI0036A06EF9
MPESREPSGRHRGDRQALLQAALTCAQRWRWPVVPGAVSVEHPGVTAAVDARCSCGDEQCPVPAAHPHDVPLLAATTEARMVRWWWERHSPQAPLIVATGRRVAAVSLPAAAGARLLGYLDALRVVPGPVLAGPTRWALLVAPYGYPELAELLVDQERSLRPGGGPGQVPSSVRYHGPGGYLVLPPSRVGVAAGAAAVRWVRRPVVLPRGGVRLPEVATLLEALVAAGSAVPDGSKLAY